MKRYFSMFLKLGIVILIFGAASMAFAGRTRQQPVNESMLEQVIKRGILRVGTSTFLPWSMRDKKGKLIGFEIDVATRLARDMRVKVVFVPTRWAGIIPALLTGKFDVIIGGMGIRPDRNLKVNFSIPYDYTGMSMAAHKEVARGFKGLADFNRSDVVIAVRLGSTAVAAIKKFLPRARMRMFDDESQAYQELINGRAHAVVGSAPMPAFQVMEYPEKLFLPLETTFTREPIGFAVRKGDFDTLNYLNNWIRVVEAEGWLRERKHYWFETDHWRARVR